MRVSTVAAGLCDYPADSARSNPFPVVPTHYDLVFKTDLESLTFAGEGRVALNVRDKTRSITLNYNPSMTLTHLSLSSASLSSPHVFDLSAKDTVSIDEKDERLVIKLPESLRAGEKDVSLRMAWTSELNGSMLGYYRSSWHPEGPGGKESYYALTQFEPTGE